MVPPLEATTIGFNDIPFMDRDKEVEYLLERVREIRDAEYSKVVIVSITGLPGAGKTSLLREFCKKVKDMNVHVVKDFSEAVDYPNLGVINELIEKYIEQVIHSNKYKIKIKRTIRNIYKNLLKYKSHSISDIVMDTVMTALGLSEFSELIMEIIVNFLLQKQNSNEIRKYILTLSKNFKKYNDKIFIFIFDNIDNKNIIYRMEVFLLLPLSLIIARARALIILSFRLNLVDEYIELAKKYNRIIRNIASLLGIKASTELITIEEPMILSELPQPYCQQLASLIAGDNILPQSTLNEICYKSKGHPLLTILLASNAVKSIGGVRIDRQEEGLLSTGQEYSQITRTIYAEVSNILGQLIEHNGFETYLLLLLVAVCGQSAKLQCIERISRLLNYSLNINNIITILENPMVKLLVSRDGNIIKFNHKLFAEIILNHAITKSYVDILFDHKNAKKILYNIYRYNHRSALVLAILSRQLDLFLKLVHKIYDKVLFKSEKTSLLYALNLFTNIHDIYIKLLSVKKVPPTHHYCRFLDLYSDILLKVGNQYHVKNILVNALHSVCVPERIGVLGWVSLVSALLPALNYYGEYDLVLKFADDVYQRVNKIYQKHNTELLKRLAVIEYNRAIALHAINGRDNLVKALKYYKKSAEIIEQLGFSYEYKEYGEPFGALPMPSIKVATKIRDRDLRFLYLLIPDQIIHLIRSFDTRLGHELREYFTKIVEMIFKKENMDMHVAQVYINSLIRLSRYYLAVDGFNKALELSQKALEIAEKYDIKIILGPIHSVLAKIYEYIGSYEKALEEYNIACRYLWETQYLQSYVPTMLDKIELLLKLKRVKEAKRELSSPDLKEAIYIVKNDKLKQRYNELKEKVKLYEKRNNS